MFSVGFDQPHAFNDPSSPMLTATQAVHVTGGAQDELEFAAFVQWALQQQAQVAAGGGDGGGGEQPLFDLVLEPHSGCKYGDLMSRAMYGGNKWAFNEHALLGAAERSPPRQQGQQTEEATAGERDDPVAEAAAAAALAAGCKHIATAADKPANFILYFMAGAGNFYQTDALGFTTPDANASAIGGTIHDIHGGGYSGTIGCPPIIPDSSHHGGGNASATASSDDLPAGGGGVVAAFIQAFNLSGSDGSCSSQYPKVEPDYSKEMAEKQARGGRGVCMMCAQAAEPFFYDNNPMSESF
jgi:hypothetical protein